MSPLWLRCSAAAAATVVAVLFCGIASSTADARPRREVVLASSAQDRNLVGAISALGPEVRPDEAALIAQCAFTTGRDLKKKWRVVWPPGLQNFLVHNGSREGGLCFQWAEELLVRLHLLKLESVELHWAEAYQRTASEHNVVVVTAKQQAFADGVLLDNWRYGGRLAWGWVRLDPEYKWGENQQHYAYLLTNKFRARIQAAMKPANQAAPAATAAPRSAQR